MSLEKFYEDGFLVLKNFIEVDLINQIREEWDFFHKANLETKSVNDEPLVVFWRHVPGDKKKLRPIREFPSIKRLAFHKRISDLVKNAAKNDDIRLLETIIFSKPPKISTTLNWHQDVAYFPFEPNNQIATWVPLEKVTHETGAMQYVVGSHKNGFMGSVNLHTGEAFKDEDRPIIPNDPEKAGYKVVCAEMEPGDIIIHDGLTWHCSGPNTTENNQRRGLSLRYLVGETKYKPRSGSAASFIAQVEVKPGDIVKGVCFPNV